MDLAIIKPKPDNSFDFEFMGGSRRYAYDSTQNKLTIKTEQGIHDLDNPSRKSTLKLLLAGGVDSQSSHEILQIVGNNLNWNDTRGLAHLIEKNELDEQPLEEFKKFQISTVMFMYLKPSTEGLQMLIKVEVDKSSKTTNSALVPNIENLLEFLVKGHASLDGTQKVLDFYDKAYESNELGEFNDFRKSF